MAAAPLAIGTFALPRNPSGMSPPPTIPGAGAGGAATDRSQTRPDAGGPQAGEDRSKALAGGASLAVQLRRSLPSVLVVMQPLLRTSSLLLKEPTA
jgi:hypothetical protein